MTSRGRKVPTRYGDGAVAAIPGIVDGLGARRVLLVCGRRSFEASGAAAMLPGLERSAQVLRWSDFAPNTDATDLAAGLAVAAEFGPDLVLGVGGGSALDMSKLLCAYATVPPVEVVAAVETGATVTSRDRKLVLVPTTSGSGAEMTHFAVVYVGEAKHSITGPGMYADHIVLDPRLALSGSPHQRATSGIDAVCQAIESLWATGASAWSRRRARWALRILLPALETFVNRADDTATRAMCIGSHLAGQAIDVSRTTGAHALSYALTKRYGVDHGSAVALTLGAFIEAHATAPAAALQPSIDPFTHAAALADITRLLGVAPGSGAAGSFRRLLRSIGLPTSLGEVGIADDAELWELVSTVNAERLGNNPVRFDGEGLHAILADSLAV